VRIPRICKILGVEEWREIEEELCIPLRSIIPSVDALQKGWPEAFRERIEALRGPRESKNGEPSNQDPTSTTRSVSPTNGIQENGEGDKEEPERRSIPWPFVAIPILIVCLFCIPGVLLGRQIMRTMFGDGVIPFAQAVPTTPAPTETPTQLPTNTKPVIFTQTSSPTSTETPIPSTPTVTFTPTETPTITNTPLPTETPTPAIEPLFFDDFTDGKSDMWQTIYGEPIIVNNALSFQATTLMVIDANDWTDYEVSFDVSNMQCQGGVGSRGVTIGQRYQNANNMVALRIFHWGDYCDASWYLIKDGDWNKIPNASFPLPPKDSNGVRHFILSVEGNTYNSPFGVPLVIEDYQTGGVALLANKNVTIDNFRVIPLDSQE